MRWRKQGLVYAPSGDFWWARSHAHLPTVDVINDEIIRVYFASLDENKFGRVGYAHLDAEDPHRILDLVTEPVLDLGELGAFDDCGVTPSCVVNIGAKKYLYYIGWQRCERVPYMLFTGLAVSNDNGRTFERHSRVPVLDRTTDEPFSRSAPFVLFEDGVFKVWYWTCVNWTVEGEWTHYNNVIKYATSEDGLNWTAESKPCITPDGENDYAVGRPWVIKDAEVFRMWYSIRSKTHKPYRIGYAESNDGVDWVRKDEEVGIEASEQGWDSEMICYPCVVSIKGKTYMFYNGNKHGESGFGYAILEH